MTHLHRHPLYLLALACMLVLTPLLAVTRPQPASAAGVVSQCTEAGLRAALAGGGLVTFNGCTTITLADQVVITEDTVIDGGGEVELAGDGDDRLIEVAAGVAVTVTGLTLRGGQLDDGSGGAILNNGTLTVTASTFTDNDAELDGGAIFNSFGGTLTVMASTFTGNSADDGGALSNVGTLTVTASTFTGNSASDGGAIFNNNAALAVTASTFTDNAALFGGGAIFNSFGGPLTVTASTFTDNDASFGGAIRNGGPLTVTASTFTGNDAAAGGAIFSAFAGTLTITASTFTVNDAAAGGALLNSFGGTLTVTASTFTGNSADENGGAIRNFSGTLTVTASTFTDNAAESSGGAISNVDTATVTASILSGSNLCGGSDAITSGGYNVASDDSCNLTATGDLQGADPLLGSLQDNGGPTLTILPNAGSPALGRVPNAVCAILSAANDGRDQRGAPRPVGADPCDSGAVEVDSIVPDVWLLAAYATPSTVVEGQSATITAFASGPLGAELQYTFGCPTGTVGPQAAASVSCTFPTDGAIEVLVTASTTEAPVSSDSQTVTVTVNPVQVVVTLTPPSASFAEGGSYQGEGAFTTDGPGPWEASVDYGDGSAIVNLGAVQPGPDILLSHQYLSAGDYTITLNICDITFNRCGTATASVTVTEAQLAVTLTPPSAIIGEGDSYEGSGEFTTDGPGPWAASVDYGDGSPPQALDNVIPMTPIPISHPYLTIGDYTITLEICDTTVNRCGQATADVTVTAVAPSVTITPVSLNLGQGDTFHASGSFTDPGLGPWTATVDYGQGAGPQPLTLEQVNQTFNLSRPYLQQGSFPVIVVVCDAFDACGSATVTVEVGNVPPDIQSVTTSRDGSRITLRVEASDPGGGPLTYRFSCAGTVIGPQASPTASCDYPNQTGQFAVLVEVIDANQVTTSQTVLVELPTSLCVGERSGTPRFMGDPGGCVRGEQPLVLTSVGNWSFCVGERSGSLRYLFNGGGCLRGEWQLTLPEDGPITVCVGERSRSLRYVANANQCNVRGELVYRIANRIS